MLSVIRRTMLFHLFECYHKLSVVLCDCIPHPQLGSVCLGSGHKIDIVNITHKDAHTCFSPFLIGAPSNKYMYFHQSV